MIAVNDNAVTAAIDDDDVEASAGIGVTTTRQYR
jgi:hypothetical protein